MEKATILVVDDTPENIDVLDGILKDEYRIKIATNGRMALKIAEKTLPDLILLDVMMPEMDGYEVCERLKENPLTRRIPVIFVTAKDQENDEKRGFEVGAVDYVTKPISGVVVKARIKTQLALFNQNRELEKKVDNKTKELNETRLEIIKKLGRAAEYKDNETGMHVERMSRYCKVIALEHGFSEKEAELLLNAAPMHDIGKIGIPDSVLQKPGKLDNDEWNIMRTHCKIGAEIIGEHSSELLKIAKTVASQHHEKWNGKGYPRGMKGDEINLYARIVAVADVFDALTSKRPYKDEWSVERAVNLIKEESGEHFDPQIVKSFVNQLPQIVEIKEKFKEE